MTAVWAWLWACSVEAPPEPPPVAEVSSSPPAIRSFDPSRCVEPVPGMSWENLGEGKGGLKHAAAAVPDLDGDGLPERFVVRQDAGSGEAAIQLTLEPTAGPPIGLSTTISYEAMRHVIEVPTAIRGPDRATWRAPFEQELLRLRCPEPDPSHARLIDPTPRWYAGPPILPFLHGTYDPTTETWSLYSGHTHTMDPPAVGSWPVEDEVRGSLHLSRTQHGVVVWDAARDAHTWVWVTARGQKKLRLPTVALAGFDGDAVAIELQGTDPPAEQVRIPLTP